MQSNRNSRILVSFTLVSWQHWATKLNCGKFWGCEAMPTYREFREVLRKAGFVLIRSRKHEVWWKQDPDGTEHYVLVSHQHGKDIPPNIFAKMLRQAGLSRDEFERLRKDP
jgi:predicted RNA binding protein YcfA (HicA-like mRNA interferase family)